ncbi:hypothetical protein [Candidatus Desulfovibrio trichonymphae]|uniref:Uncharacterized protein n=1 Tax=Candidatus Desulfovibrio trichonymphae TaxID=1725232 RepID=A0A1J1DPM1_9BACT|nr:hypothetical protein [Candidatus Desulfovibrio trichonymphae]BAV91793.1 conserved hypothetical protein [Candidatus Desulfovibrio trichonymphae]GHU97761.1 hypothetical protein AGMMS50248_03020 [Deltaproteobacteria bacterium]
MSHPQPKTVSRTFRLFCFVLCLFAYSLTTILPLLPVPVTAASAAQTQITATGKKNGVSAPQKNLHARPWTFGQSPDREADIWRHGKRTERIREHAVSDAKNGPKAVNTAPIIDRALKNTEKKQGGLNVGIRNESASWRPLLPTGNARPYENQTRTGRHIVGAFADVKSGDDLSIRLGPELILKDEQSIEKSASNQPDSALGMGMQFKLDF